VTSEPADRAPAPGSVRIVQRFINTVDLEEGVDAWAHRAALARWLADAGLLAPDGSATAADLGRAVALREALRALALANAGHPIDPQAIATVNAAAARACLVPQLHGPASATLEPHTHGVDRALGRVVAALHEGIADGTWKRLKACESESCRWAYYDHSRNRSGHWCSMTMCGSREKNRRAYRRRRTNGA
jgi:predicted RNA-binding Zn ribbon-like protein